MSQQPHSNNGNNGNNGNSRRGRPHLEAENVRVVPGEAPPVPGQLATPPQPKGTGSLRVLKRMYRNWRIAGGTPDIFAPCAPPGKPMTPYP